MLDVDADLALAVNGTSGRLRAQGQQILLELDEPSALIGVVGRRKLGALAEQLARAGCTLSLHGRGRLLLVAGLDAQAGPLERLLRLPRVTLSPRFALYAVGARGRSMRRRLPSTPDDPWSPGP